MARHAYAAAFPAVTVQRSHWDAGALAVVVVDPVTALTVRTIWRPTRYATRHRAH